MRERERSGRLATVETRLLPGAGANPVLVAGRLVCDFLALHGSIDAYAGSFLE